MARAYWTRDKVLAQLERRRRAKKDLSWTGLKQSRPSLAAAILRHFGDYANALQTIGVSAVEVRRQSPVAWTKPLICATLKKLRAQGEDLSSRQMMKHHGGLLQGAIRRFGNYEKALRATTHELASPHWANFDRCTNGSFPSTGARI